MTITQIQENAAYLWLYIFSTARPYTYEIDRIHFGDVEQEA